MSIRAALGFMALGGAIVAMFNFIAWRMYWRGKEEMKSMFIRRERRNA